MTVNYDANKVTDLVDLTSQNIGYFSPNPSLDYTYINYHVASKTIFQITDVMGKIVRNISLEGNGEKKIFVGDLNKGIYFGNLLNEGNYSEIRKLIINK